MLTGQLGAVLSAMVDHEVYVGALRQLSHAAGPARAALVPEQAAEGK
ncbi:hypothetical protein ABT247_25660 [Kitasatospora sp. NPDC001539]